MEPRIELLTEKKLVGKRLNMTLSNDRTFELWHSFMPHRKEIKNSVSTDLFCLQVYDKNLDFKDFNPLTEFEKWAAIEVSDFKEIPDNMETYTLKGGLYAVFIHKGAASSFPKTFQFIFNEWLPKSEYELDNREHFDLMGDKYKNNDPESEEEIWVPVRLI
ncbi:GyrI-like domain-containing protein [uncultured Bacteroides sp.]|uniref:GyrI-like domain-containing protein n=1 Tax=uncultured Bacteroides sp. TaxID=162156 RepID=UPI002AAB495C|nr:GyrI-like domain-containing protein [uncultured Bacteroides sp.]